MTTWNQEAAKNEIQNAKSNLENNNMNVHIAESLEEAKKLALDIIPEGSEIMDMTSVTLAQIGLTDELYNSRNYKMVRNTLNKLNRETDEKQMKSLGSAPEWAVGSVHAVTEQGEIIIASNTGSQLPAYAYGALNVLFIVGSQKIVNNLEQGFKRIYEHSLPLESERAKEAYGVEGSNVSKVLIINEETRPNRINMIIVKEAIGF